MSGDDQYPEKTTGLVAATFTPFSSEGTLDLSPIPTYAQILHREGLAGVFISGTTGECPSLTTAERKQLTEAWVKSAPRDLRIFVHVGHNCLQEARELARHAAMTGADAVACMAPYFFRPRDIAELVDWCAAVASAAPDVPFYYYHMPSITGINFPMADLMPVARERIPNFCGMKYTYEDLDDFSACLAFADGRYDLLFGRDERLLTALEQGATGAVGSTYNFTASLNRKLMDAFSEGDLETARKLQEQAVSLIDLCIQGPWHTIAAFKWLMSETALDFGPPRLPVPRMTIQQVRLFTSRVEPFFASGVLNRLSNPADPT
jgi:N-acetylneuraminate lyase